MTLVQSKAHLVFESVLLNAPFIALAIVFLWNLFDASAFGWFSLVNGPFIIITEFFTVHASGIVHAFANGNYPLSKKIVRSFPIYLFYLAIVTAFSFVFGFTLFIYFWISTISKTISFSRIKEKARTEVQNFIGIQTAAFIFFVFLTLFVSPALTTVFPIFNKSAAPIAEPGFSWIPDPKGTLLAFWGFCYFSAISLYSIKMQLKKGSPH